MAWLSVVMEVRTILAQSAIARVWNDLKATDLHPQILLSNIKKLPIAIPELECQNAIEKLVKDIVDNGPGTEKLSKIDELVYKIYDLTPGEIQLLEDSA